MFVVTADVTLPTHATTSNPNPVFSSSLPIPFQAGKSGSGTSEDSGGRGDVENASGKVSLAALGSGQESLVLFTDA